MFIMRILASLKRLSSLFPGSAKDNVEAPGLDLSAQAGNAVSFSDQIEAVAAEHEWVRSRKRSLPKSLPRSPRGNDLQQLPLNEYDSYVESFIDWIISIGENSEQSADELLALARIFESWSGWGRAHPARLFRALGVAGIKSRRLYIKPNDPRYKALKKELKTRPYLVVYRLKLLSIEPDQKPLAA